MKKLAFILAIYVFPLIANSQIVRPEAVAEAMSNTFNLYGDKLTGTCFMITKDGKQYFVTAAHLFQSSHKSGDPVSIRMVVQNQLQSFDGRIYFHQNRNIDIAVLKLSENISQHTELPEEYAMHREFFDHLFPGNGISTDSLIIPPAMEVFFFGFPLGNLGTEIFGLKLPLTKKAVVSGWMIHKGIHLLLLDGHNNAGFSGGPVVGYDTASKRMKIVSVISGYVPEPISVKQRKETFSVNTNSGIIISYDRRYINDIFKENSRVLR